MRYWLPYAMKHWSPKYVLLALSLVLFAIGIVYTCFPGVQFGEQSQRNIAGKVYDQLEIISNREREFHVNLVTYQAPARSANIVLNGQRIAPAFDYEDTRVAHQDADYGDIYRLSLKKGANKLDVIRAPREAEKPVQVAHARTKQEIVIFFVLLVLPALLWLYLLAAFFAEQLAKKEVFTPLPLTPGFTASRIMKPSLLVLLLAIDVRVWYGLDMGYIQFQHDYHGHVEYLKFFAEHLFLPLPHKGWEYPQQPLYYVLGGGFWKLMAGFNFAEEQILFWWSQVTNAVNIVGLVYAYLLARRVLNSEFSRSIFIIVLGLTPSFVYLGARINNDPWAAALACIAFFYIVRAYNEGWRHYTLRAVSVCCLLFLTKVSGAVIILALVALIAVSLQSRTHDYKRPIFWLFVFGAPILFFSLYRAYYPAPSTLAFVNSGIWPGQDLRPMGWDYLLSFNIKTLFVQGEANIWTEEFPEITRSFPTYQYGTLLFGEFGYEYWRDRAPVLSWIMPALIICGLIIPLCTIAFFAGLFVRKDKWLLDWVLLLCIVSSTVLILNFAYTYPSVSNTDFRYHCAVFLAWAYLVARGAEMLARRHRLIKWSIAFIFALYGLGSTIMIRSLVAI